MGINRGQLLSADHHEMELDNEMDQTASSSSTDMHVVILSSTSGSKSNSRLHSGRSEDQYDASKRSKANNIQSAVNTFFSKNGIVSPPLGHSTASQSSPNEGSRLLTVDERNALIDATIDQEMNDLRVDLERLRKADITVRKYSTHVENGTLPQDLREKLSISNPLPADAHKLEEFVAELNNLHNEYAKARLLAYQKYAIINQHHVLERMDRYNNPTKILTAFTTSDGESLVTGEITKNQILAAYKKRKEECLQKCSEDFSSRDAKYHQRIAAKQAKQLARQNAQASSTSDSNSTSAPPPVASPTTTASSSPPLSEARIAEIFKDTFESSLKSILHEQQSKRTSSQHKQKKKQQKVHHNQQRHQTAATSQHKPAVSQQSSKQTVTKNSSTQQKRSYRDVVASHLPPDKPQGKQSSSVDKASAPTAKKRAPHFQQGSLPPPSVTRRDGGDRGKQGKRG